MQVPKPQVANEITKCRGHFEAVLLGTAVGDALGLPAEGLSPDRIRRRWNGEWRMRFLPGRGMISDDTEHTLLVAQALIASTGDAAVFQRILARKLRWWFASMPGGVGLATARACLKLWLGFPPTRSAVRSGGSGPAMRSAIIGAFFADDAQRRKEFVLASSRLTHSGWQAETAAHAVAEAAALAVTEPRELEASRVLPVVAGLNSNAEWLERIGKIETALRQKQSVSEFAHGLGLKEGISGFSLHVVPLALFSWLRHSFDFRSGMVAALDCGGDTDTVGAILGALCGVSGGVEKIPAEWVGGIVDWPRSVVFLRAVATRLAERKLGGLPLREVRYFWPGLIPRNLVFLATVLLHGFRRLLPPY